MSEKYEIESSNEQVVLTVALFLKFKKSLGVSERTLDDYKDILERFFNLFPEALDSPRASTLEYLSMYDNSCSFNIRYSYLKCFWDWCIKEDLIKPQRHPLDGLKKRRTKDRIVQVDENEITRLLKQPKNYTFAGIRDYALLCLQIDTGIRPNEALQLTQEDFSPTRQEVSVRAEIAKTRQPRTLPISKPTANAMIRLIEIRPANWKDVPVFCTEGGRVWAVSTWSKRVLEYSKQAGVQRLTAYSLRHAAALLLLRRGADAFTVQRIMGHTTMEMTRHYLALTTNDIKKGHEKAAVMDALLETESQAMEKLRRLRRI